MADITTSILKRVVAGGFIDSSFVIDAAGNQFLAIGVAEYPPTNNTWVEVYKIPPAGPVPNAPQWRVIPSGVQKIDAVTVYYSGTDLMVELVTHEPGPAPRDTTVELGVIPGVFVYEPGMQRHSGGPGAFVGEGEPDPGGGGEPVDYARVEAIVQFQLQTELAGLVSLFGGQGIRQGLEDKAKDALVETLTGTDPRAQQYKDALFDFVKNANAGVQANILGGNDPWGVARRDELKAIIREVLDEGDDGIPTEPVTP